MEGSAEVYGNKASTSNQYRFAHVEKGIRGCITQAVHHYATANNNYMGKKYNPDKESSYLQ